jgi:hypothetical protein
MFDTKDYEFHKKDCPEFCFICKRPSEKFFIMRQIKSMKMVHLCEHCMLSHLSEYYLDNTRPWLGKDFYK